MNEHRAISRPLSEIRKSYSVVVVGSGYGGGVAASRLARTGQSVCLLERGREILPGEYPKSLSQTQNEIQVESERGHSGSRTAMIDLRLNDDVNVVLGCGLGGTSLINANVALEMKTDLFKHNHWPEAYRSNPTLLDPYYEKARSMLEPTAYPDTYPELNKLKTLKMSADAIGEGDKYYRPPINVTFEDRINKFGVPQSACVNCGDCCSGCNYGAKNTTLMNYLPDAANHGAELFTEASVRYLEKSPSGWVVHVESVNPDIDDCTVRADVVILGAGTLGSTEILKRSQREGLNVSPALGERFSGNGDILAFGYNSHWKEDDGGESEPIYGVGQGDNNVPKRKMPGPVIAGIVDMRSRPEIKDRMVIEDGVIPGPMTSILAPAFFFADAEFGSFMKYGPVEAGKRLKEAQKLGESVAGGGSTSKLAYEGPVARTQTYLVMSHDDADGKLELKEDRLRLNWKGAGTEHAIVHGNNVLKEAAEGIEAQFIPNLLWTDEMAHKIVTVHPIGGCCMADRFEDGVVNQRCQVFSGPDAVHEGLYVCDGAVIPGALGVNPLFTISAIAERAVHLLALERDWQVDYSFGQKRSETFDPAVLTDTDTAPPALADDVELTAEADHGEHDGLIRLLREIVAALEDGAKDLAMDLVREVAKLFPDVVSPGLAFTETMHGYFFENWEEDPAPARERISNPFELAFTDGKAAGEDNRIRFKLTISCDDVYHMIEEDSDHRSTIEGHVFCEALSSQPMKVHGGSFCLLKTDPDLVDTFVMTYDMVLDRKNADPVFFRGTKYLRKRPGSSPWKDLTTLYVDLYLGDRADSERHLGRALMTLNLADLQKQIQTFSFPPGSAFIKRHHWLDAAFRWIFMEKYAAFFARTIMKVYGGLLADLYNFAEKEDSKRKGRKLKAPDPVEYPIEATDGARIRLVRYPCDGGPAVVLAPGFSVAASSFAADTLEQNVVEALWAAGHDVWLFDYRASPDSGSATQAFTVDDIAAHDWPAAVKFIRDTAECDSVQAVVHCVGSMSLLMSLLRGLQGIHSVISSQLTLHPVTNWLNDIKSDIGLADIIRHTNIPSAHLDFEHTFDMRSSGKDKDRLIDTVLYQLPVPDGEACNNPVCRRVFAIFGPSWAHANLNHETHIALREWFGEISTKPFEQLSKMIDVQKAVDSEGRDVYLPNVDRLKLPISFIAGSANQIFLPETSRRTYDWLCAHNGSERYSRKVFEGYAHMDFWIGKDAGKHVFPWVVRELEKLRG